VKNGKIYLSLSDAIALALENNFDIAIARYTWTLRIRYLADATGAAPWVPLCADYRHAGRFRHDLTTGAVRGTSGRSVAQAPA